MGLRKIDHRNINFNWILISLYWFLIAELYRYLCCCDQSFKIPIIANMMLIATAEMAIIYHLVD